MLWTYTLHVAMCTLFAIVVANCSVILGDYKNYALIVVAPEPLHTFTAIHTYVYLNALPLHIFNLVFIIYFIALL